jgi:hypothetical protein
MCLGPFGLCPLRGFGLQQPAQERHRVRLAGPRLPERGTHDVGWIDVRQLQDAGQHRLTFQCESRWRDLARRVMPQFAVETGLGENLRWVAAMHQKVGKEGIHQPHIHVVAWVREGAHGRRPDLSRHELRNVRRAVAREVFGPLRAQLAAERTTARGTLVAAGRHNLAQMRRLTLQSEAADPATGKLPPAFSHDDMRHLAGKVQALAPRMPGKGRVPWHTCPPRSRPRPAPSRTGSWSGRLWPRPWPAWKGLPAT